MSMDMYFGTDKWRKGRPVSCLATTLQADMKQSTRSLKNTDDLRDLRSLAANRDAWKVLVAEQLT